MRRILMLLAMASFAAAGGVAAEEVTLEYRGLTLNANLETVDDPSGGMVLLVHGTLAHNGMEIIAALQGLLAERGPARVYLRDWPRNRGLAYPSNVTRVADLLELARLLSTGAEEGARGDPD